MLKRSGRAHDSNGIDATMEGACAVLCPACLQPGRNLPSNWRGSPPTKSWLYGLFVGIDTNFHLKCKIVSKDSMDPSLSNGWGYFVKETVYKAFLNSNSNINQESTCSSHNAVNIVDTKSNCGLAATGLGTINCTQHNMKLPMAVGDLQKGEKYINMDYLFFSLYDIVCQWNKNLWHHMTPFPPSIQLNRDTKKFMFFVPKFHLPTYIQQYQTKFSFNFTPNIKQTNRKALEQGWANINPVALSTKEMGPGARRDTLDNFFGHTMLHKMKDALPELLEHEAALVDLEEGLKEECSDTLSRWKEEVEAWERDPLQPNPYECSIESITLASVHLELAKEEAVEIGHGGSHALHKDCSPSTLISSGLELEEQQRCLTADKAALGIHAIDTQEGKLVQCSNSLQHQIEAWTKVQELYMPMLAAIRQDNTNSVVTPESFQLLLPSQTIEWKLRYAQAHNALHALRSNLCAQTAVLKYKDRNLHGQGTNTRACNTLKGIDARIKATLSQYQDACKALVILAPLVNETGWQFSLWPLNFCSTYIETSQSFTSRLRELSNHEWEIIKQLRDILKILKDTMLFFSHATPNLATVISAMDLIEEKLMSYSRNKNYSPAIRAAVRLAKETLNRYYELTDRSEVYCIAMVLHPRHKLAYFKTARWEDDWINTAETLVRDKFQCSYCALDVEGEDIEMESAEEHMSTNIFDSLLALVVMWKSTAELNIGPDILERV
ncbi:hypothetical protein EV424DRAFT_1537239 [Suillus variegatus]|nr:hypothetical protein EV424DRAFT_1537239 [Suillus variegatus]